MRNERVCKRAVSVAGVKVFFCQLDLRPYPFEIGNGRKLAGISRILIRLCPNGMIEGGS